jgi:hypothetical protein
MILPYVVFGTFLSVCNFFLSNPKFMTPARSEGIIGSYESLLKIWDFFHVCEKFRLFMSGA